MKHLFVYGSLKPGGEFYPEIEDYVLNPQPARIDGDLYDSGYGFPAVRINGEGWVKGIVYTVNEQDWEYLVGKMDFIEGFPFLYERTFVRAILDDGSQVEALVYFGNREDLFVTKIESGEWNI